MSLFSKKKVYFPGCGFGGGIVLISIHSFQKNFLIQRFGAQHGLILNLHGTQFLPNSRLSYVPSSLLESSSSSKFERRNIRALSLDSSKSLSLFKNNFLPSINEQIDNSKRITLILQIILLLTKKRFFVKRVTLNIYV
jgi:hypothetical protein